MDIRSNDGTVIGVVERNADLRSKRGTSEMITCDNFYQDAK